MSDSQDNPAYRISAEAAAEYIKAGALVIDVRSEAGRQANGELHGAVVIAKPDVLQTVTTKIGRAFPGQKTVVFCGSVKGSGPIVDQLVAAGYDNVHDVDGGFAALVAANVLPKIERPAPTPV